jgi:hypothetical protein
MLAEQVIARTSILAVVALSCRAAAPSPPVAAPTADATAPATPPIVTTEPLPEAPSPPPARTLPAPQVLTPTVLPWPADAIYVEAPVDDRLLALFPDERAEIRRVVARSLERRGAKVIPIAKLEHIEQAAATGVLTLDGDRRCSAPLLPSEVARRWFATSPHAAVTARCDNDDVCALEVFITGPVGASTVFTSKPVRRREDPKAWIAAARSLHESEEVLIGLSLSGTGGPMPAVRFDEPTGIGTWAAEPDTALFTALEPSVAACAHPDPLVGMQWTIRTAIARTGKVDRCVAETDHLLARPADATCLCDAVRTIVFPRGAAGRRLRVDAFDDGEHAFTGAVFTVVQPGTDVWIERLRAAPILRRCTSTAPLKGGFGFDVEITLANGGAVTDVFVGGDVTTPERMRFAACIVDNLGAMTFPCAPPGITALRTKIERDT